MNSSDSEHGQDHHTDATMAPLWVLLLAVIVVVEIGFLPVTRSLFAAVLP